MMRWIDSVMFSQDPLSGVYSGMMPWSNNHTTNLAVRCPARLSMTSSIRSGGSSSGNVGLTVRPACQRSHAARWSSSRNILGGGNEARIEDNSASNQACNTTLGQLVTPLTRTWGSCWMEERQQLGRAMTHVFMRIPSRPTDGLPVHAWLGNGLVWTGFVHAPHGQPQ